MIAGAVCSTMLSRSICRLLKARKPAKLSFLKRLVTSLL